MIKKVLIFVGSAIFILIVVYFIYKISNNPHIDSGGFETSRVETGSVFSGISAAGVVEPGSEVLVLSPASSVIKDILKEPGSKVMAGEVILYLDPKPIEEEIDRIKDQIKLKENNLEKNQLSARTVKVDLDYNVEVKKLRIASLKSEIADQEQLLSVGGISPARFEKTKQELALAEKDLETIHEKNSIRLKQLEAEEEGLRLQIQLQEKELSAKEELLREMAIKAPSSGIILEIDGKKGEKVTTDRLLVKMSDLSAYKIRGSIDDKDAGFIKTGRTIYASIDNEKLWGKIGVISPVVRNDKLEFDVYLEQSSHAKLLPNLNVELMVITEQRDSVLRIKKGPAFDNKSPLDVYGVKDQVAKLRTLDIGIIGLNYIEILSGASEGDILIISDISAFKNQAEVALQ